MGFFSMFYCENLGRPGAFRWLVSPWLAGLPYDSVPLKLSPRLAHAEPLLQLHFLPGTCSCGFLLQIHLCFSESICLPSLGFSTLPYDLASLIDLRGIILILLDLWHIYKTQWQLSHSSHANISRHKGNKTDVMQIFTDRKWDFRMNCIALQPR